MKGTSVFITFILIIIVVLIFRRIVGDIRPAVLPPKQSTSGEVSNGKYKLEVFASEITDARDLQFTDGGTLLVSSPKTGKIFALPNKKIILSNLTRPHGLTFHEGHYQFTIINLRSYMPLFLHVSILR